MQNKYDVIIIGGGPTGAALGIELGLQNIKTLILEKHEQPLLSPRAQSLNERSMELAMRWRCSETLKNSTLLPKDYPMQGVWCSKLNGVTYGTASSNDQFKENVTAQKSIRIPLYITENILREKLGEFECVTLLKNYAVENVVIENDSVIVTAKNKLEDTIEKFISKFAVACDGANSVVRSCANIAFQELAPKRRVLNVLFETPDLQHRITVDKGFIYYIMGNKMPAPMGPVDLNQGIWYAQIFYSGDETDVEKINISFLLDELSGISFQKIILNAHFWMMQIQIAEQFSKNNRIFLVGDSAHAFSPTGGFGLNTGFGDVVNLAWKLSAVIKNNADEKLLSTYENERKPVALCNLNAAERNARDAIATREKFPPEKNPELFVKENARIAKQHAHSAGITMGYAYFDSPLTQLQNEQSLDPMPQDSYVPTAKPGYFLPHAIVKEKSIYDLLSPTQWTLIVCGKEKIKFQRKELKILHAPENAYSSRYILIRPDWHIAMAKEMIMDADLNRYFAKNFGN